MIIFTPVDLPKIEPDDWPTFWSLWNQHSRYLEKVRMNHGHSQTPPGVYHYWKGLDIYNNNRSSMIWAAPCVDWSKQLPQLYQFIESINDFGIYAVRLIQSQVNILPHSDHMEDRWCIRAFLHSTSPQSLWYFTRPGQQQGLRTYIRMPEQTNWFMYNDLYSWHGSDYVIQHPKILLQIFSTQHPQELLQRSIHKYRDFSIDF